MADNAIRGENVLYGVSSRSLETDKGVRLFGINPKGCDTVSFDVARVLQTEEPITVSLHVRYSGLNSPIPDKIYLAYGNFIYLPVGWALMVTNRCMGCGFVVCDDKFGLMENGIDLIKDYRFELRDRVREIRMSTRDPAQIKTIYTEATEFLSKHFLAAAHCYDGKLLADLRKAELTKNAASALVNIIRSPDEKQAMRYFYGDV